MAGDVGSELGKIVRVGALAGTLFLGGLAVGYYSGQSSGPEPTRLPPIPTAAATATVEPTKTAVVVPTPITAPTVESFKETNYIWAMRYMAKTFDQIAPHYLKAEAKELTGVGIALMLTETDANTKNWLQIETATQKESLADLKKRVGDEQYKKLVKGATSEELALIAACAKVGKDYETIIELTGPGELAEMRRVLMYYSYNGGLPLTKSLWQDWLASGRKKGTTWVDFYNYTKETRGWPLWLTDVDVYRSRAEQLYDYAIQTYYDFLRGNPPTEAEVQNRRMMVFLSAPARKR